MKKTFLVTAFTIAVWSTAIAQEYKIITVVEAVATSATAKSRIIETKSKIDSDKITTERVGGRKVKQKKVKRKDRPPNNFAETKLNNLYTIRGVNFNNIAYNDAVLTDRINKLTKEGWEMVFVNNAKFVTNLEEVDTGVLEVDQNNDLLQVLEAIDGNTTAPNYQGFFITRYIFKRD